MKIRQIIPVTVLLGIVILLSTLVPRAIATRSDGYRWFDPIVDIRGHIMEDYVETPDDEAMQEAVIKAMIESLDDPFTTYIAPEDQAEFSKELSGNYVGIGARIHSNREWLTILTPMEGSPALKAGILAGDVILDIEGVSTQNRPVNDCIDDLLGEPGSTVHIRVRHADDTEEDITITRAPIRTKSVFGVIRRNQIWNHLLDDERGIAYIRIESFTERTASELRTILETLESRDALKGLVIDVRDNRGGALTAALETSDMFIDEGTLLSIRSARPDRKEQGRIFKAHRSGTLLDVPLIVLVNDGSASASEIVAGSLKDNERALVLGERSFGKGSVQEVRELDDEGGLLKFTTAHYYLPSGRSLHKTHGEIDEDWGVDPSEGCLVGETLEQGIKRIESRQPWIVISREEPLDPALADPAWLRETLNDEALARSVELLGHHVDTGMWPELEAQERPADLALRNDLERALDVRDRLEAELVELQDHIHGLEGITELADHGITLPEDGDIEDAVLVIRNKDGEVIGTWAISSVNDLQRSLSSVELTPIDR